MHGKQRGHRPDMGRPTYVLLDTDTFIFEWKILCFPQDSGLQPALRHTSYSPVKNEIVAVVDRASSFLKALSRFRRLFCTFSMAKSVE